MIKSLALLSTKKLNMVNIDLLIKKDLHHIWHPCTQMKEFETFPPLVIERAEGSYIYTNKGPIIDGISSWWCKSLGHGHPVVINAIRDQLNKFEHVITANTTHTQMAEFGETLAAITGKQHVFFGSDGSSAVEISMKLAMHAQQIKGVSKKNQFIALKNGYHGETFGALSVSDLGIYKAPYEGTGVNCHFIESMPYVGGTSDPLWSDCEAHWQLVLPQLELIKDTTCAVILEPIIQGAAGMLCYSANFLQKIAAWAKANDIYLITDEIMTGIGRTGTWLASSHANITPDLICLSKGLTSGSIPMSCVMIDSAVYDLFYDESSFLHSHTYSGNPLGIAAALATIRVIQEEDILPHVSKISSLMVNHFNDIAQSTGKLINVRGFGAIVAAELVPCTHNKKIGSKLYEAALNLGALLRPIRNTLYWLPPLNASEKTIGNLAQITLNSINTVYKNN